MAMGSEGYAKGKIFIMLIILQGVTLPMLVVDFKRIAIKIIIITIMMMILTTKLRVIR